MAGFLEADYRWPAIAPDRQHRGLVDAVAESGQRFGGDSHHVDPAQRREPQSQRQRPDAVASGRRLLFDKSGAQQAHQIAVRFGRRHARGIGEILELNRRRRARQRFENAGRDLDRLDARPLGIGARA